MSFSNMLIVGSLLGFLLGWLIYRKPPVKRQTTRLENWLLKPTRGSLFLFFGNL